MDQSTARLNVAGEESRARLLDAAAACFAERGYAATSVRDITARAGCNVGAVNYHFETKERLYVAVYEHRLSALTARRVGALQALAGEPAPTLERVLETFAEAFIEPLQSGPHGPETLMLLLREMTDGLLPGRIIAERMIGPTMGALMAALDRACPGLGAERLGLCCHSLVAQLVHVVHIARLHARSEPGSLPPFEPERTVRHVVRFTAAGVRGQLAETGR